MALNRIPCPECGAALKSPSGFTVGHTVCCPKCETYFVVEEPDVEGEATEEINKLAKKKSAPIAAEPPRKKPTKVSSRRENDEDDEQESRPKKKKKKRRSDDDEAEHSYRNSPLRYAILTILIIIMLVGAYFLVQKYRKENNEDEVVKSDSTPQAAAPFQPPVNGQKLPNRVAGPGGRQPGGFQPPIQNQQQPKNNGFLGGAPKDGGFLNNSPLTPAETTKLIEQYKAQLVGTWKADLGDGFTAQLVFTADGKVSETITNKAGTKNKTGTWLATGEVAHKGMFVTFGGQLIKSKPVKLTFEEDDLQYPVFDSTLGQDVVGIFHKA
jgi:Zn-finger nucleic acid-binding protein